MLLHYPHVAFLLPWWHLSLGSYPWDIAAALISVYFYFRKGKLSDIQLPTRVNRLSLAWLADGLAEAPPLRIDSEF